MRSRVLGAAIFFLSLQLLAAASAPAQGQQPPTPPKARPSDSGIAHNVITWFHHVTGSGARRHRIVSSPPLPRSRPPQLTKTPAELPAAAVEPKEAQPAAAAVEPNTMSPAPSSSVEPDKAPAVELNDAQSAGTAVEPNKTSPAPDTTVESAKQPTVEPNEAQPAAAAVELDKMSPAPPSVEPDKSPAELPAAAVEQNEAPPRSSVKAVLRGPEIPD